MTVVDPSASGEQTRGAPEALAETCDRATLPPPSLAPQPGSTFHGLHIHSKLGEGGMGAAYLASHPVLRMPLVLKTFKAGTGDELFREAHLAARVASPHVVGAVDAGVEHGTPFVVQRYIDGIDLDELLNAQRATGRRLPVEVVSRVVVDAARGLHAIHQAGVVHRDIKPSNLFLCGNGSAAVGDFGVAIESRSRDVSASLPHGTPLFMAPEQWSRGRIDRRSDLYSLGATAHTLATSDPPFEGESALMLGVAHTTATYRPPHPRDPREAYLFAVIERLLRKNPDERHASADEVVRALSVITPPLAPPRQRDGRRARFGEVELELVQGDLARHGADVIVNAANAQLSMAVGVAVALRMAGGDAIEREAKASAPAAMGDVVWTGAGDLLARWVAHAVAAIDNAICLQRSALRVLLGAEARRCESVAFPALGTGVGGVPMALGAKLLLESVQTFSALEPRHVRDIRVVLHSDSTMETWVDVLGSM